MSDNSYGTNFGPSTDGAVNLISGQLNGVSDQMSASGDVIGDGNGGYTLISDADPIGDVCSTTTGAQVAFSGTNVGDLLNASGISWGFFEGGFDLTVKNANGTTGCARSTTSSVTGVDRGGLHSAPPAVPVLPLHAKPAAYASQLSEDGGDPGRPGKPPVRYPRLLRCDQCRQLSGGQLSQGSRIRGRPRRILRPS